MANSRYSVGSEVKIKGGGTGIVQDVTAVKTGQRGRPSLLVTVATDGKNNDYRVGDLSLT